MKQPPLSGQHVNAMERQLQTASEQEQLLAAITAIRSGNQDAFAHIVCLYQKRLYSLALMFVRDRAAAEDIVQEAFVRAYTHLNRYEEIREFYPWIATITARLALNWRRSRVHVQSLEPDSPHAEFASTQDLLSESILEERAQQLWSAVSSLSQGERTAVLLFYKQDMSIADVANVLGVTIGSVKTMLFRAREKLRKSIADRDLHETCTKDNA
jgi:RNA polymerase sigma-70 factor, ECF subfamily